MRRSRNRNMGRNVGNHNKSGGPLLTEHLRDIDLELDLLKRKREMLEQQTQFLQPFNPPQRNFNQQPFYLLEPKQGGSHCDFSHLYNDGPQQYRKPFGKKRQSDNDWQNQSFPKRSAGNGPRVSNNSPSNRNARPFNTQQQQPKTTPSMYAQGKQSIGKKIANQKPQPQQRPVKNFVPTKVTKPKAATPPPNKIASKPVADRSKLVAAAIKSATKVDNHDREALRLVADKVPTKQMTGRLELALGNILRDIKQRCAESGFIEVLRSFAAVRVMKNAIRERIRTAMLGKIVGNTLEITCEYRTMFPKETDVDIINKALEASGLDPVTNASLGPIVSEEPVKITASEFYHTKVNKLLYKHLIEMFSKLEDVYKKEFAEENKTLASDEPIVDFSKDIETEDFKEMSSEKPQTVTEENTDDKVEAPMEGETEENTDAKVEAPMEGKTEENTDAKVEAPTEGKTEENTDAKVEAPMETAEGENEAANGQVDAQKNDEMKVDAPRNINMKDKYKQFLSELSLSSFEMKRMMPYLMKKHVGALVKVLNINYRFRRSLASIITTTQEMYEKQKPSAPVIPTPVEPPQIYYVKIMGIPELPSRNLMQAFLMVFRPVSIKKHKTVRNLLFIGLRSEELLEEIVKADGTVIADMKLSIRVCESNTGKSEDNASTPMPANKDTKETNQASNNDSTSSTDLLGAELDEQITDLLSSIRNSEENKPAEGNKTTQEFKAPEGNITQENITEEGKIPDEGDNESEPNESPADVADETNAKEILNETGNTEVENSETSKNGVETQPEKSEEEKVATEANVEKNDQVSELKTNASVKGTPTRASNRLASTPATPSSIRTRRASRLLN